jgi:hypothetical protein
MCEELTFLTAAALCGPNATESSSFHCLSPYASSNTHFGDEQVQDSLIPTNLYFSDMESHVLKLRLSELNQILQKRWIQLNDFACKDTS